MPDCECGHDLGRHNDLFQCEECDCRYYRAEQEEEE